MAVKWYNTNKKNRVRVQKTEFEKLLYKSILNNENISNKEKLFIYLNFIKYDKWSSNSYYRNYSIINYNGRAVFRLFKLHRLVSKQFASKGILTGLRKASF